MKIKLDIESPQGAWLPVTVTAEGTATAGDVASAMMAGMTGRPRPTSASPFKSSPRRATR